MASNKVQKGRNDLVTWCEQNDRLDLLAEWNNDRNKGFSPEDVSYGTDKRVWWKCSKGHEWLANVNNRTIRKSGCPYCKNRTHFLRGTHRKLTVGVDDLESWCKQNHREDILAEFDVKKNKGLLPNSIKYGSGKLVWWTCLECGESWTTRVHNRTLHNSGCPNCKREYGTSFCEQAVFFYVKQLFPDALNGDNHLGTELDIYIPSISTAIEYDGEIWHGSDKKASFDDKKGAICSANGVLLIRVREPNLPSIDNSVCFFRKDSVSDISLSKVIVEVLQYLDSDNNVKVNVSHDTSKILGQYAVKQYQNSLEYCFPEIARKWHPTKNGRLTPDKISKSSAHKVWWLDDCGHEYNMSVNLKTRQDNKRCGCPICGRKKARKSIVQKRGRRVCCIETGQIFSCLSEAGRYFGLKGGSAISAACNDRSRLVCGFHWAYVDEQGNYDPTIIEKRKTNQLFISTRLGETRIMNCGMKCTVIRYKKSDDIDVEFEDGFVAFHKSYANFLKGGIGNPNITPQHIGETITTKSGFTCSIIAYRSYNDIDVQFSDGSIVEHRNYGAFLKGEIGYPNYRLPLEKSRNSHIGETKMMNCDMKATIIRWNGYNDIDVQFEDGTIVSHKSYSNYKNKKISNPNIVRKCDKNKRTKHIGETKMMNCGMTATILCWKSCNDIDIQFADGTIVMHRSYSNFKKGGIMNPRLNRQQHE